MVRVLMGVHDQWQFENPYSQIFEASTLRRGGLNVHISIIEIFSSLTK